MMKIKVNEKEYTIKFGYEPTLKSRLLSRVAKMSVSMKENAQDNAFIYPRNGTGRIAEVSR